MTVKLGKLAPPHPDGKVKYGRLLAKEETVTGWSTHNVEHTTKPKWCDDPSYYWARDAKKKRAKR